LFFEISLTNLPIDKSASQMRPLCLPNDDDIQQIYDEFNDSCCGEVLSSLSLQCVDDTVVTSVGTGKR